MRLALTLAILIFAAGSASAAPLLLAEVEQRGWTPDIPSPVSVRVEFLLVSGEERNGLAGLYSTADVGTVVTAPAHQVPLFHTALTEPGMSLHFLTVGSGGASFGGSANALTDVVDGMTTVRRFVPKTGYGLSGFQITQVTQTIDYIDWTLYGNQYRGAAQQTVRIYGEPIPEPTTWLLLTISGVCALQRRQRRLHLQLPRPVWRAA